MTRPSPTSPDPGGAKAATSAAETNVARMIDLTHRRWEEGRRVSRLLKKAKAARLRQGGPPPSLRKFALAPENRLDPSLAQIAVNIYLAYPTKAELEKLLARRRKKDGRPLALSTLAILCRPSLEDRREELIERVLEEGLGENQLKDLIRAEDGRGRKRPEFGQMPKPPESLTLGLKRWEREARKCMRYTRSALDEESVGKLVLQASEPGVNVATVEGVEQALKEAIESMKRQMDVVRRIKAAVAAREAKREAESGDEPGVANPAT